MRGEIDPMSIVSFTLLAVALTATAIIGYFVIWPALDDEVADAGATTITSVLIGLELALWGLMRGRNTTDVGRMVKALYDHFELGDDRGGRCDKCGRGG